MSLATMFAGVYLIVAYPANSGLGWTLVGMVASAWFIPNAAKQVAQEINTIIPTPPTPPTSGANDG